MKEINEMVFVVATVFGRFFFNWEIVRWHSKWWIIFHKNMSRIFHPYTRSDTYKSYLVLFLFVGKFRYVSFILHCTMTININICKISKCIMYIFACHTYLILNYNVTHFKHNLPMNNILCARWQIKYLIVLIIPFHPFMNISCYSEINWIDNVSLNIQRFLYYSYTTW